MAMLGSPPPVRDIYEAHAALLEVTARLRLENRDLREQVRLARGQRRAS